MKGTLLFLFLALFFVVTGQAQNPAPAKSRAGYTLEQQFNSMKSRSSPYKEFGHDYRVVRVSSLDAFLQSVQDTLKVREQSIRNAGKETAVALEQTQKELETQKAQVQALQKTNAEKEQLLQQNAHDVSSLSVLGLDMAKQVYVTISLLAVLALAVVAGIFAFLYQKSNVVTQEKIRAFDEVSEELKNHKQAAREKELKLKREQQSEANRVEELKQRIAQLEKQSA